VSALHPRNRPSVAPRTKGRDTPDALADFGERVSRKLAEVEAALEGASAKDISKLRNSVAELRSLLDSPGLDESIARHVEAQVADRTRELSSLSNFLQTQSEREKAALARELHDALGGILTPAKMDLSWLEMRLGRDPEYNERMRRLSGMIDQGIDLKRRIIEKLRPSLLDHLGLASALQWFVDETCRDACIECSLQISDKLERLPSDMEIALYRLVQESVGNIVKHANAKRLDLVVERTPDGLKLLVGDDGVGIPDVEYAKTLAHGLAGMMLRVRSVNGTFDIHSQPNKGTRISVFVPL
jgi:signal transduction histidine kinase